MDIKKHFFTREMCTRKGSNKKEKKENTGKGKMQK
jgi:hypothetical protein